MSFGLVLDERYVYYVLFHSVSSLLLYLYTDSTPYRTQTPNDPIHRSSNCRNGFLNLTSEKSIINDEEWDGYPGHLESHLNGGGVGGNEETRQCRHPPPQRGVPLPTRDNPPFTTTIVTQRWKWYKERKRERETE